MECLVRTVVDVMNDLAPQALAESWDNVGLQVGHPDQPVNSVFLALTPSMDVIERAIAANCQMLVTHHPLIFKGPKTLRSDCSPGREVSALMGHGVAHFCAHTNLDIADTGVNDVLAERLGLSEVTLLDETGRRVFYKVVVFVPDSHLSQVQEAAFAAGAGRLGHYEHCAWSVLGEGQFRPREEATPFIGEVDEEMKAAEHRMECLAAAEHLSAVLVAIRSAHPYEEPAIDVFQQMHMDVRYGIGRIGFLPEPMPLREVVQMVAQRLDAQVRHQGDPQRRIEKVALCGGSAANMLASAARQGADCYITGDVSYHNAQQARELGIALIDAGHFATERPVLQRLQAHLQDRLGPSVRIVIDQDEKDFMTTL